MFLFTEGGHSIPVVDPVSAADAGGVFGLLWLVSPAAVFLAGAALAGATVPVLATLGWTVAAGVRLEVLGYAVWGFRTDASAVLAASIFHFGDHTIAEAKAHMRGAGLQVRLDN